MDESGRRKFISLSLLILILSVFFFCDFKKILDLRFFKEKYILIIGILSSPDNFQKRLSIRNTWLKLTQELPVSYYFVIGEKFCRNHPLDRLSAYSCEENSMSLPENATITNFFNIKRVPERKSTNSLDLRSIGFGFETLHDVDIKGLGVLTNFMNFYKHDLKIKIISSDTKAVLVSVNIPSNRTSNDLDFNLASVNNLRIKRGWEVQVLMELIHNNISYLANCDDFEWNLTPGVINYVQLFQPGFRKPWPFQINSCSYVLMSYDIADLDNFKARSKEKRQRQVEWDEYTKNLGIKLKNESEHFRDIAFINVVDIYQNLPKKLVQFFKRLTDTEQYDFVLKTDDDVFVDVPRVFKKLSAMKDVRGRGNPLGKDLTEQVPHFWWWSNFRESWKVQESGKWREDKYRSPAYPSFPCGGGYVLCKGLVSYLSENRMNLQYFQGEDVSVGIWLSALRTVQCTTAGITRGDHHWIQENILKRYRGERAWVQFKNSNHNKFVPDICDWTCDRETFHHIPLCNRVELSVSEMYETWNDYIRYGFIQ